MSNATLLQILAGLAAFLVFASAWRRFGTGGKGVTSTSPAAEEPCWTEAERRQDGLSYGRSHGYNSALGTPRRWPGSTPRGGWARP